MNAELILFIPIKKRFSALLAYFQNATVVNYNLAQSHEIKFTKQRQNRWKTKWLYCTSVHSSLGMKSTLLLFNSPPRLHFSLITFLYQHAHTSTAPHLLERAWVQIIGSVLKTNAGVPIELTVSAVHIPRGETFAHSRGVRCPLAWAIVLPRSFRSIPLIEWLSYVAFSFVTFLGVEGGHRGGPAAICR